MSGPAAGTPVATPVRAGFPSYSGQLAPVALAVPTGLALAGSPPDGPPAAEQAAATSAAATRAVPPASGLAIGLPR